MINKIVDTIIEAEYGEIIELDCLSLEAANSLRTRLYRKRKELPDVLGEHIRIKRMLIDGKHYIHVVKDNLLYNCKVIKPSGEIVQIKPPAEEETYQD